MVASPNQAGAVERLRNAVFAKLEVGGGERFHESAARIECADVDANESVWSEDRCRCRLKAGDCGNERGANGAHGRQPTMRKPTSSRAPAEAASAAALISRMYSPG